MASKFIKAITQDGKRRPVWYGRKSMSYTAIRTIADLWRNEVPVFVDWTLPELKNDTKLTLYTPEVGGWWRPSVQGRWNDPVKGNGKLVALIDANKDGGVLTSAWRDTTGTLHVYQQENGQAMQVYSQSFTHPASRNWVYVIIGLILALLLVMGIVALDANNMLPT